MWCANCGECIWAIVIEFCRKILQQDPKSNPESNPIQRSQPLHIQMIAKSEFQTTYPKIQNQRCSTPHEHCWWNHFQSGKSTGIVLAQGFHPFHYSKRRGSPPSRRLSKWIGRSETKKKIWGKNGWNFRLNFPTHFPVGWWKCVGNPRVWKFTFRWSVYTARDHGMHLPR